MQVSQEDDNKAPIYRKNEKREKTREKKKYEKK